MATYVEDLSACNSAQTLTVIELVVAAQAGDQDALATLFGRYESYVQSLASRYVDSWDDAAEVSQEVFILVMRRLRQLQVPAAFGGWLRKITHRTAINFCRRRRVAYSVEPETLDANAGRDIDPADRALNVEVVQQVHSGLNRLKACDRRTLEAFYLQDRSLLQMADDFKAPVGTIKRRLHVARKRLAKELEVLQAV